jgi:hypothetical protein
MQSVLNERIPLKLQTDQGKEFDNSAFRNLMKKYGINFFMSKNKDIKCSIVERFNKTLKNKMFKYFSKIGRKVYINVLESFLKSYNKTYHRSIKMTPINVNESNQKDVFYNLYKVKSKRELLRNLKKPKLKIGDKVRKKYILGPLERGYYPNWSDKVYSIEKTVKSINKPLYFIKDSEGVITKQRFYPEELQKITDKNIYRVEKILSEKVDKGKKYLRVKWLNHPSTENSWILSEDLLKIGDGE